MPGRKSSFLMRARKMTDGERVELTHLESQATGRFASLDEAVAWVRARWTEWDARPVEREDAPATPAKKETGMTLWTRGTAWAGRGLRRGEAVVLAAAVLVIAIAGGDAGLRDSLASGLASTQLAASGEATTVFLALPGSWTKPGAGEQAATYHLEAMKFANDPNNPTAERHTASDYQALTQNGVKTVFYEDKVGFCFAPKKLVTGRTAVFKVARELEATVRLMQGDEILARDCFAKLGYTPTDTQSVLGGYLYGPSVTAPTWSNGEIILRFDWVS